MITRGLNTFAQDNGMFKYRWDRWKCSWKMSGVWNLCWLYGQIGKERLDGLGKKT